VSARVGLLAALLTTLHPYLIWHDVHLNREILDSLLAVAVAFLTLLAAEKRSIWAAAGLGGVLGLAILGNARLAFLPLVLAGFLVWRFGLGRRAVAAVAVLLLVCAITLAPWAVRNRVALGCYAITTDSRALWKANNENTYDVLARGGWIDDVPKLPNAPLNPFEVGVLYADTGQIIPVDECAQMSQFQNLVYDFWQEHPGEKARLAWQAGGMLWNPVAVQTEGGPGAGTWLDTARDWAEPLYMVPLFVLAAAGLFLVPRLLAVLVALLLAYQTVVAMVFVGATRYRVPWDFLVILCASAALVHLAERFSLLERGARLVPRKS
jgi:hypothetical protein